MRVGVISDTHGLLRPEALKALQGAEHILHAGDVGDPSILDDLRSIAPVTAIRGNIDEGGACSHLDSYGCRLAMASRLWARSRITGFFLRVDDDAYSDTDRAR